MTEIEVEKKLRKSEEKMCSRVRKCEKCTTMKQFGGFVVVKTERARKSMECLLRWKARKIRKLMKMELRRSKSVVVLSLIHI